MARLTLEELELMEDYGEELIERGSNRDLCYVMEYIEPLRKKAWRKLLERGPTNEDLCYIIVNVETQKCWSRIRKKAWRKLLEQGPTNKDLLYIMNRCRYLEQCRYLEWEAYKKLLELNSK